MVQYCRLGGSLVGYPKGRARAAQERLPALREMALVDVGAVGVLSSCPSTELEGGRGGVSGSVCEEPLQLYLLYADCPSRSACGGRNRSANVLVEAGSPGRVFLFALGRGSPDETVLGLPLGGLGGATERALVLLSIVATRCRGVTMSTTSTLEPIPQVLRRALIAVRGLR